MPDRLQGVLEPYARMTCTYGSEGAGAQQCAPATRLLSPLLANVALSVLDEHFARRARDQQALPRRHQRGLPWFRLVRYADDWILLVRGDRAHVEALRGEAAAVLALMGLRLSDEKTKITHVDGGLDFLGWRIQRHRKRGTDNSYVYTYPSKKALRAVTGKVRISRPSST